jgi:hypothetical protein
VSRNLADDLDDLRPEERRRLGRFAEAFDRIDARDYSTFAPVVDPDGLDIAQEHANDAIRTRERRHAVRGAIEHFVDAAARGYSRRMSLTDTFLLNQSLPDLAEDRVRFAQSVERAVVALALWDDLADEDRVTLLGPWGAIVIPLIEAS